MDRQPSVHDEEPNLHQWMLVAQHLGRRELMTLMLTCRQLLTDLPYVLPKFCLDALGGSESDGSMRFDPVTEWFRPLRPCDLTGISWSHRDDDGDGDDDDDEMRSDDEANDNDGSGDVRAVLGIDDDVEGKHRGLRAPRRRRHKKRRKVLPWPCVRPGSASPTVSVEEAEFHRERFFAYSRVGVVWTAGSLDLGAVADDPRLPLCCRVVAAFDLRVGLHPALLRCHTVQFARLDFMNETHMRVLRDGMRYLQKQDTGDEDKEQRKKAKDGGAREGRGKEMGRKNEEEKRALSERKEAEQQATAPKADSVELALQLPRFRVMWQNMRSPVVRDFLITFAACLQYCQVSSAPLDRVDWHDDLIAVLSAAAKARAANQGHLRSVNIAIDVPQIKDLGGIERVCVQGTPGLRSISGLHNIQRAVLTNLPSATHVSCLANVQAVTLKFAQGLTDVSGLRGVPEVSIYVAPRLSDISPLCEATSVSLTLCAVEDVGPLASCERVHLATCQRLRSIQALSRVKDLSISDCNLSGVRELAFKGTARLKLSSAEDLVHLGLPRHMHCLTLTAPKLTSITVSDVCACGCEDDGGVCFAAQGERDEQLLVAPVGAEEGQEGAEEKYGDDDNVQPARMPLQQPQQPQHHHQQQQQQRHAHGRTVGGERGRRLRARVGHVSLTLQGDEDVQALVQAFEQVHEVCMNRCENPDSQVPLHVVPGLQCLVLDHVGTLPREVPASVREARIFDSVVDDLQPFAHVAVMRMYDCALHTPVHALASVRDLTIAQRKPRQKCSLELRALSQLDSLSLSGLSFKVTDCLLPPVPLLHLEDCRGTVHVRDTERMTARWCSFDTIALRRVDSAELTYCSGGVTATDVRKLDIVHWHTVTLPALSNVHEVVVSGCERLDVCEIAGVQRTVLRRCAVVVGLCRLWAAVPDVGVYKCQRLRSGRYYRHHEEERESGEQGGERGQGGEDTGGAQQGQANQEKQKKQEE